MNSMKTRPPSESVTPFQAKKKSVFSSPSPDFSGADSTAKEILKVCKEWREKNSGDVTWIARHLPITAVHRTDARRSMSECRSSRWRRSCCRPRSPCCGWSSPGNIPWRRRPERHPQRAPWNSRIKGMVEDGGETTHSRRPHHRFPPSSGDGLRRRRTWPASAAAASNGGPG